MINPKEAKAKKNSNKLRRSRFIESCQDSIALGVEKGK
jgi:hypothetical protein